MKDALKNAIAKADGPSALARILGITSAAVSQWTICPALRVLAVEAATGVSKHELRPDLYPPTAASRTDAHSKEETKAA